MRKSTYIIQTRTEDGRHYPLFTPAGDLSSWTSLRQRVARFTREEAIYVAGRLRAHIAEYRAEHSYLPKVAETVEIVPAGGGAAIAA